MAYNYYGQGYVNPYANTYYPQTYQPVVQQPVVQPQYVQQPTTSGILWVSGDDEVNAFPVAPNNAVRLWHRTKPIVYFKEADAAGRPTIKIYDLTEHTETAQESVPTKTADLPDYATKSELSAVVGVVKGYDDLIASMKADVDGLKSDVYGIVGKKKTVRKQEVIEDD